MITVEQDIVTRTCRLHRIHPRDKPWRVVMTVTTVRVFGIRIYKSAKMIRPGGMQKSAEHADKPEPLVQSQIKHGNYTDQEAFKKIEDELNKDQDNV